MISPPPNLKAAARWWQVKDLLARALDLPTDEQAAFLRLACAEDAALHQEVADLLHQTTGGLDACAGMVGAETLRRDEFEAVGTTDPNVGRRVGAWTLGERLGAGGMGTVYLARRADQAFEQTAAIKLLRRGTDTEEVLRRFRAERQILARLDHPGIVRLLDGGATDDGLPFFVLERVDGQPVTVHARTLTLPGRLRLFLKICAAVQYAHERLIVHRDLKPGNILVTADGKPKLLDFGIAKLLAGDEGDVGHTLPGHGRMTPGYASPEQARGEAVTVASDVYALGALLYELLVGHNPHRFKGARPTPTEIARVVGETAAVRPSHAVADPTARRALRGDLDNILLKALEKEPGRRYPNVGALADDVGHHLKGRPVRARPHTLRYRTAKFLGRNRKAAAALAVVAAVVAGGVVSTVWQKRLAEHRYGEVRGLTNSYLHEIQDAIRDLPGSTPARELIVGRALEYLERLNREAGGDRPLQLELATAYLSIGDVQGKPYTPNLGESANAVRSYTRALEIARPLASVEHGAVSAARRVLGQAHESLGCVQSRLQRWEEATRNHHQALEIRTALLKDDPTHTDEWRRGIVADHLGLGDAVVSANRSQPAAGWQRAALAHYRRTLPLCEQLVAAQPGHVPNALWLAKTCSRIAMELSEIGQAEQNPAAYRESAEFHHRALALDEEILGTDPGSTTFQRRLADELIATGYLCAMSGEGLPEALQHCQRAVGLMKSLAEHDLANAEARQDLSSAYYVAGKICQAQHQLADAVGFYRHSLQILEPLVAEHPGNVETAFDLRRVREELRTVNLAMTMTPSHGQ